MVGQDLPVCCPCAITGRLERVTFAIESAIRLQPAAGEPGHRTAGQLAAALALIFRARLDPAERVAFAGAALLALEKGVAARLRREAR